MSHRIRIALALTVLFASGCARSAKVATVHVEQPGTHVISSPGAISVARNDGAHSRVCTRLVAPSGKGRGGKAPQPRGAEPGAQLDVLLFRLCEARGNGDISAEQYAASVQTIVKVMETRAQRPPPRVAPIARPGRGFRRGLGPWRWRANDRDGDDDDGGAAPEKPEAPKR
jgi:hypothetical protein